MVYSNDLAAQASTTDFYATPAPPSEMDDVLMAENDNPEAEPSSPAEASRNYGLNIPDATPAPSSPTPPPRPLPPLPQHAKPKKKGLTHAGVLPTPSTTPPAEAHRSEPPKAGGRSKQPAGRTASNANANANAGPSKPQQAGPSKQKGKQPQPQQQQVPGKQKARDNSKRIRHDEKKKKPKAAQGHPQQSRPAPQAQPAEPQPDLQPEAGPSKLPAKTNPQPPQPQKQQQKPPNERRRDVPRNPILDMDAVYRCPLVSGTLTGRS